MSEILEKLEKIQLRFEEVTEKISDPEVVADMDKFVKLNKEFKDLKEISDAYKAYKDVLSNIISSKEMLKQEQDEEFIEMAKATIEELQEKKIEMEADIKTMLVPKDPNDTKDAIMEIRAGTGGDEAAIFVGDLFRMYTHYMEEKGWKAEVMSAHESEKGGFKEISINISGAEVYGTLKFESGVHRVQRVPQTESQGRVHTSAVTVAVLPEADEVDVQIDEKDIKRDTFRASGAGGQHINKTESAIRLTHIPTGIVVECQDERSQFKNLAKAMKHLRAKIYEMEVQKKEQERAAHRKSLVSTGDRSAKIRTYNYPQGRVTDHRIGLTLYNLDNIMNGDIEEIIEALRVAENAEKMKQGSEEK